MTSCIFCKIARKEIPSELIYDDDDVFAIRDIAPQAPVHLLIIPKAHIPSILELLPNQQYLIGKIHQIAGVLADQHQVSASGFRIVNNCGADGGQAVQHLHFHLLGGRAMQWPPG